MQISKHFGKRTCLYDENVERRISCPEWTFSQGFLERLKEGADANDMSQGKYFERIVQNFFILENSNIIIIGKRNYNKIYKKSKSPRMLLHPIIIEDIKKYAELTASSSTRYIEMLFSLYHSKYKHEIQLKNLIRLM
ncbi:MAG: hypothetical protein ACI81I_000460 [Arcobacteraceae bacterium]|jgi:hypothetical protein